VSREYAISLQDVTVYEVELTVKLIQRMYGFCKKTGIKLIILDIPKLSSDGKTVVKSSIPENCLETVKANCDALFYTGSLIDEYAALKQIHVLHGQRHISADTHSMLGKKIGKYILGRLRGYD